MKTTFDRIVGCIVGGAIGDIIGGIPERSEISLSDDTQLTMATCEAIISEGCLTPKSIADSFLKWFKSGRVTGVGSSTLKALVDLAAGSHWALAGAKGERAAGNGAAMRIAPLSFVIAPYNDGQRTVIRDICRITHHSDEAYIGALAVILAINSMSLQPASSIFNCIAGSLPDCRVRDRLIEFAGLPNSISIREVVASFGSSGYVVETVPLSILAADRMTQDNFEKVMGELVYAGGDTDTICAIAGQIAGSHIGYSKLPENLLGYEQLKQVVALAEVFAQAAMSINGKNDYKNTKQSAQADASSPGFTSKRNGGAA